jgi:AcrR family transcriptional regulator
MRKRERRHQLLDVAAALLADEDVKTVTMERIAERAGVSKALPYAHFDNAEHLLVTLYQRTSVTLGASVWEALESAAPDDDLAHVWIRAHFRCGATQGVVFEALIRPGSTVPAKANRDGGGELFVARLLHRYFGVDKDHAHTISGVIVGAFLGASHTWLRAEAPRPTIEAALADLIRALVAAAPSCNVHDHDTPRSLR